MQKITIGNDEYQFKKLDEENFKTGAAAFHVIDKEGKELFLVNVPDGNNAWDDGIATPNDGILTAICHKTGAALAVAASINIAHEVANLQDKVEADLDTAANKLGIDTAKLEAEIRRLRAEGKTDEEIIKNLRLRKNEFKKEGDASSGTDAKRKEGEW